MKYEFGKIYMVDNVFARISTYENEYRKKKYWRKYDIPHKKALFIGKRNIRDVRCRLIYDEGWRVCKIIKTHTVGLFIRNGEKPFYAQLKEER